MKRNKILVSSHEIGISDLFDGKTFDEIRIALDRLEEDMVDPSKDYEHRFHMLHNYDYFELNLNVYRDESDAEYKARMAKNKLAREKAKLAREKRKEKLRKELMAKESDERAEYERLKAKFGA